MKFLSLDCSVLGSSQCNALARWHRYSVPPWPATGAKGAYSNVNISWERQNAAFVCPPARCCLLQATCCSWSVGWNSQQLWDRNPTMARVFTADSKLYRGADKSLARPGMERARKHVRDACDFSNIETRAVISIFPCKARRRRNFTPFWQKH